MLYIMVLRCSSTGYDVTLQLIGEGYVDEVTLDNLHSVIQETDVLMADGNMADDDVAGEYYRTPATSFSSFKLDFYTSMCSLVDSGRKNACFKNVDGDKF